MIDLNLDEIYKAWEDVTIFTEPSYATALIGVSTDNRAVYDFNKMVEWLQIEDGMSYDEAVDFIGYNTLRALPYEGERAPIVVNLLEV